MDKTTAIFAIGSQILVLWLPALLIAGLVTRNNNNNNIVPHGEHAVFVRDSACVINDVDRPDEDIREDVLFCWNMLLEEE